MSKAIIVKTPKHITDMENFENLIEKFKPIYASEITKFYAEKFAISALKLLIKLGVKEGEIYRFDERKKRLRGLDKLEYIGDSMIGLSYHCYPKESPWNTIEVDEKFYEFQWYWMDEIYGEPAMNCGPFQLLNIDDWSRVYNYLRREANSKKNVAKPRPSKKD